VDGFIVYLNLVSNNTHLKQAGLPGVSPTPPVSITLDSGLRLAIWTLAPSYTVMRNDVATLDVITGIRYTSLRVSIAYELSAPSIMLTQGGGRWPKVEGRWHRRHCRPQGRAGTFQQRQVVSAH
jgi:hypothetical protein